MARITIRSINEKIDNTKNEILLDINKKRLAIKIVFLLVVFVIFLASFFIVPCLEEYVPFNSYNYEIQTYNGLEILRDFEIYHDFSNNKGRISFKINKEDYVKGNDIEIQLPVVIDNKTVEVYYWEENGEKIGWSKWYTILQQNTKGNYSRIMINDIPFLKNNDKYFYSISYEMEIFPHGHFKFYHHKTDLYGKGSLVTFDLGKKYKCDASCIYQLTDITAGYANTNKKISLLFEKTKSHSFILKGIKDIGKNLTKFIGLLVSSSMLLIVLGKEVFEELPWCKRK